MSFASRIFQIRGALLGSSPSRAACAYKYSGPLVHDVKRVTKTADLVTWVCPGALKSAGATETSKSLLHHIRKMSSNPSSYVFNHTMIRVKDPQASVKFYEEVLGMKLITKSDNEGGKFTLYFLAYVDKLPESEEEKKKLCFSIPGVLELTHNWGTENDENFKYANGNQEPGRGFGHIAVLVDDIHAACERFEQLKVNFVKRLQDGKMKHIAFITDPDGYWIEIIQNPKHTNLAPI